jgi:protein-S-isoprenylcysteine O-methyltransferase Ste14
MTIGASDEAGAAGRTGLTLDFVEKAVLTVFFTFFATRMLHAFLESGAVINLLYLVNEAALVVFVLARRSTRAISKSPMDWFVGFAGTCLPLFLVPASGTALLPPVATSTLLLAGLAIHLWAKFTLRRSFGVVAANRGVKTGGPYRLVRHPMYAGYMLTQVSFLLAGPHLLNVALIAAAWGLQIARILAEERVLAEDPVYRAMMTTVRWRLVPGVF